MKERWSTVVQLGLALLCGYLLAQSSLFSKAQAQVSEGQAGGIICVVGEETRGYLPIILVDTREQRLLVYEFLSRSNIRLTAARPYTYDRVMLPYNNAGLTVEEIRAKMRQ